MSDPLLLAIDCGTGSTRAILFDSAGRVAGACQREWSHAAEPGVPGSQVFDTAANWDLICECVRGALAAADAEPTRVAAVSATSMREGMVLYDAAGRELWACPNVDGRAGVEAGELVASGAADTIYRLGGDWVSITAPPRLRWLAKHRPEILDATAHLGMLGDWVLTKLAGGFVTEPSLGSSSAMFDLARRTWSDELLDLCGVRRDVVPEVVPAGTVVGAVTAEAAAACGLVAGTPVVAGGADTQLGLLGAGISEHGRVTLVGGSFWQLTCLLDRPLIDPRQRLRTLCHVLPDQWMIEGIGFWSGLALRWFRDAFCADLGPDPYPLLEAQAADVPPGCGGLFAVLSNVMDAKHWVHAAPAFVGFDLTAPERSGRKECFRALQESAAYAARGHLEIVEEIAGVEVEEVTFAGGAANGTLWPQIVADVLGVPVHVPEVKESTALGAAICAGVGAGVFPDTAHAPVLASVERTATPDPERVAVYDELYRRWTTVYDHSLQLADSNAVAPMWRAAGT